MFIFLSQPNDRHLCCPREAILPSFVRLPGLVAQFYELPTKLLTFACWRWMDFCLSNHIFSSVFQLVVLPTNLRHHLRHFFVHLRHHIPVGMSPKCRRNRISPLATFGFILPMSNQFETVQRYKFSNIPCTAFGIMIWRNCFDRRSTRKMSKALEDYIRNEVFKLCNDEEIKMSIKFLAFF